MAEPADLTTAIATEVAKQVPVKDVYVDAVQPAAKQLGITGEDIMKTFQVTVLLPFMVGGALHDRFRNFLDTSVRRVPEADRIEPPPQILGPVLEGIRYEPTDTPVTEMFSQLLSSSMDKVRVHNAHPAFSQIVRQLSQDEAVLLDAMWKLLKEEGRSFRQQFTQDFDRKNNTFSNTKIEVDELPRDGLVFPENVDFYGQHLYALGITAFYDSSKQKPLYETNAQGQQTFQNGIRVFKELRFTDVGHRFMTAVSPTT